MRFMLVFFIVIAWTCKLKGKTNIPEVGNHELPPVILKDGKFIRVAIKVNPFSEDSIVVETIFTNTLATEFWLYKPLVPTAALEDVFIILENEKYNNLQFIGTSKEKYTREDSISHEFIVPILDSNNFYILKPNDSLISKCNVANKYNFHESYKKGITRFSIVYATSTPYVINNRQVVEMDSLQKKELPVYYFISNSRKDMDIDSIRIPFQVPTKAF